MNGRAHAASRRDRDVDVTLSRVTRNIGRIAIVSKAPPKRRRTRQPVPDLVVERLGINLHLKSQL